MSRSSSDRDEGACVDIKFTVNINTVLAQQVSLRDGDTRRRLTVGLRLFASRDFSCHRLFERLQELRQRRSLPLRLNHTTTIQLLHARRRPELGREACEAGGH